MATIDELKGLASTRLGFAKGNYFLVEVPSLTGGSFLGDLLGNLVPSIPGITSNTPSTREMSTLCTSATLPGRQVLTSIRNIGTENQKIAYGYAVDDVQLTFHLLNDYGVKSFFDKWYSKIIDVENFDIGYKDDYSFTTKIHQLRKPIFNAGAEFGPLNVNLDLGGGSVYTVELEKSFPTTINAIELGDGNESFVQLSVQLSYTNWRSVTPSLLSNIGLNIGLG